MIERLSLRTTATANVSLREALNDPQLLGHALGGESWKPWRTLLIAAMGEPLLAEERPLFKQLTQRDCEPLQPVEEFLGVVGRRGGKSKATRSEEHTSELQSPVQ